MANRVKRVCDVYRDSFALLEAFEKFCTRCNRNCPMGCIRIKSKKEHIRCFADWSLSKYCKNVD